MCAHVGRQMFFARLGLGDLLTILGFIGIVATTAEASRLALIGSRDDVYGFSGADAAAISPGGEHLYVAGARLNFSCAANAFIGLFARDPITGAFAETSHRVAAVTAFDIAISPDGAHVYTVVDDCGMSGIQAFRRDTAAGGSLALLATYDSTVEPLLGRRPWDLQVSPDGHHVYAACNYYGSIVGFIRDPTTGLLTVTDITPARAAALALSPDGLHVYAINDSPSGLTVFARDPTTGKLTFVETHPSGRSVTVSPDGTNVYVGTDADVTVYGRSASDGRLTFIEAVPWPEYWMHSGSAITVSLDGADVYLGGRGAGTNIGLLGTLSRDIMTGRLTFTEILAAPESDIVMSPDDHHVYAASYGWLTAYRRILHKCSSTPRTGCAGTAVAHNASLLLQDHGLTGRDRFMWRWRRGEAVAFGDFGDPIAGGTDYAVCLYDAGPQPQPRLQTLVPAGGGCGNKTDAGGQSCWKQFHGQGFRYASRTREPDGVTNLSLRAGAPTVPQVSIKGSGNWPPPFFIPSPVLPPSPLPLSFPLTVQAQAANGSCWTSTFSMPTTSTDTFVRAVSD